jgi:hypothetical protein
LAVSALALGALLHAGCGPANEENLGGQTSKVAPRDPNVPDFKSYGEVQEYQRQQAAKTAKTKPTAKKAGAPR